MNATHEPKIVEVTLSNTQYEVFLGKVKKLTTRCKRVKMPAPTVELVETKIRYRATPDPLNYAPDPPPKYIESDDPDALKGCTGFRRVVYRVIRVTAFDPVIPGGWELVARVQHVAGQDGEANIIHSVPDRETPPKFRDRRLCDHCGTKRLRKDTFIVRKPRGDRFTHKQVGRQCVADFLGHTNPTMLATTAETWGLLAEIGRADDDELYRDYYGATGCYNTAWDVTEVVEVACSYIRQDGFAPSRMDNATKVSVNEWLSWHHHGLPRLDPCNHAKEYAQYTPNDDDKIRAVEAIKWAKDLSDTEVNRNDYLYNLRTMLQINFADHKNLGILVSLPSAFNRAMEREMKYKERDDKATKSNHVGQVKDRLRDLEVTCTKTRVFDGDYGMTTLVHFEDADGNVFIWWSSSRGDFAVGATYTLTGTVKKHDDYKGLKQTVLSRCKCDRVVTEEEKAAATKAEAETTARDVREYHEAKKARDRLILSELDGHEVTIQRLSELMKNAKARPGVADALAG